MTDISENSDHRCEQTLKFPPVYESSLWEGDHLCTRKLSDWTFFITPKVSFKPCGAEDASGRAYVCDFGTDGAPLVVRSNQGTHTVFSDQADASRYSAELDKIMAGWKLTVKEKEFPLRRDLLESMESLSSILWEDQPDATRCAELTKRTSDLTITLREQRDPSSPDDLSGFTNSAYVILSECVYGSNKPPETSTADLCTLYNEIKQRMMNSEPQTRLGLPPYERFTVCIVSEDEKSTIRNLLSK
jgi:hypothetical protein